MSKYVTKVAKSVTFQLASPPSDFGKAQKDAGKIIKGWNDDSTKYATNSYKYEPNATIENGFQNNPTHLYARWGIDMTKAVMTINPESFLTSTTDSVYDYSGKQPAVTVTLNGTNLVQGTDYTVSYIGDSGRIDHGGVHDTKYNSATAIATATMAGDYAGQLTKTYTVGHTYLKTSYNLYETCQNCDMSLTDSSGNAITSQYDGDPVIYSVTPYRDCVFNSITSMPAIAKIAGSSGTFTMPESDVSLSATCGINSLGHVFTVAGTASTGFIGKMRAQTGCIHKFDIDSDMDKTIDFKYLTGIYLSGTITFEDWTNPVSRLTTKIAASVAFATDNGNRYTWIDPDDYPPWALSSVTCLEIRDPKSTFSGYHNYPFEFRLALNSASIRSTGRALYVSINVFKDNSEDGVYILNNQLTFRGTYQFTGGDKVGGAGPYRSFTFSTDEYDGNGNKRS